VPGAQKRGFGFIHDGSVATLFDFLLAPVFQFGSNQQRRDVEAFMHAFDTGTAPAVGVQQTVDGVNSNLPPVVARINLLMARADAGDIELVVKGNAGGVARGYLYAGGGQFESDGDSEPLVAEATLRAGAGPGNELTYTGVPPGNGRRIGIDRDCDTYGDFHEIQAGSNPADRNSIPVSSVTDGKPVPGGKPVLWPSSPNPMGPPGTTISFTVAEPADVTLAVYDAGGRLVRGLMERSRQQGTVSLRWDGLDDQGREAASGVYFYRLTAGGVTKSRSLVLRR
jgi:hypothetical protein